MVAKAEAKMLRANGHEVRTVEVNNDLDSGNGLIETSRLLASSSWSSKSFRDIVDICREFRPAIAHVHNFWMRLSPSVHAACYSEGVATVQTLHNFRLLCANATFLRNGQVCEDCLGRLPWRGVVRSCYRGSRLASTAIVTMISVNRARHTWHRHVDAFITLSEHSRSKFITGGLPTEKVFVKANFMEDLGAAPQSPGSSRRVVFAGRLSPEKGVNFLLNAWAAARLGEYGELRIVGDGPERTALESQAFSLGLRSPAVVFTGRLRAEQVREYVESSRVVVMPSVWYEGFPMMLVETFCAGRPVIVSHIGSLSEIVTNGITGITCTPADPADLGRAIHQLLADADLADRLGRNARCQYIDRYTPAQNYSNMQDIYSRALANHRQKALPYANESALSSAS